MKSEIKYSKASQSAQNTYFLHRYRAERDNRGGPEYRRSQREYCTGRTTRLHTCQVIYVPQREQQKNNKGKQQYGKGMER